MGGHRLTLEERGGEVWDPKVCVPDHVFPVVNLVFSDDCHFGGSVSAPGARQASFLTRAPPVTF